MPSPLPPPRRIVTGNLPLPYKLTLVKTPEPAVEVLCENVVQKAESDGNVYRGTVFTHEKIPTNNDGLDVTPKDRGLVLPQGANIRYVDIGPGQTIPMHRTQSTDYNVIISGELYLITPSESNDGKVGALQETLCRAGDVIFQRGTMHAWENRSTEWVRWFVVLLGAEKTMTEVEGSTEKVHLEDFYGEYGNVKMWD